MQGREQIIELGTLLATEQRNGYRDAAAVEGLDKFVQSWRASADGALELPAVRHALALLTDYDQQPPAVRQERLDYALELLRGLFRAPRPANDPPPPSPAAAAPADPPPAAAGPAGPAEPPAPAPRKPPVSAPPTATPPAAPLLESLQTPIANLPGVSRTVAAAFKRLGLQTVGQLLYHFPHRYDDYSAQKPIAALQIGAVETVTATVADVRTFRMKNGRSAIEVQVRDETGILKVVFFGGSPWMQKQFPPGRVLVLSGKVSQFQGIRQMSNPDWEPFTADELTHTGRLVPVHPLTKGLYERSARSIIKLAVDRAAPLVEDYLPPAVRERTGLLTLAEALAQIHFPASQEALDQARIRLGFNEFLLIQLGVLRRRRLWQGEMGYPIALQPEVHRDLLASLPFRLTGAPPAAAGDDPDAAPGAAPIGLPLDELEQGTQVYALAEIFGDLQRPVPMARLLQGDVGSGKTVVAAAALLQVIAAGFQAALMAPTEILAEQHYRGLRGLLGRVPVPRRAQQEASASDPGGAWQEQLDPEERARLDEIKRLLNMTPEDDLDGAGVRVALLTGSLGAKERRKVLEAIAKGEVDLVVGTHALITEGVQYQSLGMVCIDEQHRFGVEQRQRLRAKGFNPHMLVMTATPIPRTLTLTIYGELDTSIINKLPPGRQKIRTEWITTIERDKAYRHLRKEIGAGRQAFVICPLVEESEKIDLPSAEEMHQQLQHEIFPDLRIGLIHGRMLPREKDEAMRAFRDQEFDLLVATAVVEVGIDIPNATTMMIEGAERFGLAQLHQFRGRVGRGAHQSYCILVSDIANETTQQRLTAMKKTRDGFELAEIDLQLRGPGEFLGKRQSGTPDLKIANLADTRLLVAARQQAQLLLDDDPELARPEHTLLRTTMEAFWAGAEGAS